MESDSDEIMYLISRTVSRDNRRCHAKLTREVRNFVEISPFELKEELQSSPRAQRRLPSEDYYDFEHGCCTLDLLGYDRSIRIRSVLRLGMMVVRLYGLNLRMVLTV